MPVSFQDYAAAPNERFVGMKTALRSLFALLSFVLLPSHAIASPLQVAKGTGNISSYTAIEDEYFVVLRQGYTLEQHLTYLGLEESTIVLKRLTLINAYHGQLNTQQYRAVQSDPAVKLVEPEHEISVTLPTQSNDTPSLARRFEYITERPADWFLTMISVFGKQDLGNLSPEESSFTYWNRWKDDGSIEELPGQGVRVYVLDSGARSTPHLANMVNFHRSYGDLGYLDTSQLQHGVRVMALIGGKHAVLHRTMGPAPGRSLVMSSIICIRVRQPLTCTDQERHSSMSRCSHLKIPQRKLRLCLRG